MEILANSYFSGAGLMDYGLMKGGVTINQSYEIDETCVHTQRMNFGYDVIQQDMRMKLVSHERDCDVMVFTFPCNRYSTISDIHGTRTGDDLFLHGFRHVAIKQPEAFVVENVPGMKKFPVVMEAMTKLPGYYIQVECPVSTDIWLPQRRDRLIIFGTRKPFSFRQPEAGKRISLKQIFDKEAEIKIPNYVYNRLDGKGGYRDKPIISDPEKGDIAPCAVAHYSKDISTRLIKDKRFPRGVRPYTTKEYARLQGLPDSFQFAGTERQAYRQIGNGVSIPTAEWIGRELKRYFCSSN